MAPPRDPAPKEDWTGIIIGLFFFVILQAGAIATYVYLLFDARYACDRARDSCEVELVWWPIRREVIEQFRPSQVVKVGWGGGMKRGYWLELEMAGGAPEIRVDAKASPDLANRLRAFIADPAQPRFHHVVRPHGAQYVFGVLVQLLALIIFSAGAFEVNKRQRAG